MALICGCPFMLVQLMADASISTTIAHAEPRLSAHSPLNQFVTAVKISCSRYTDQCPSRQCGYNIPRLDCAFNSFIRGGSS